VEDPLHAQHTTIPVIELWGRLVVPLQGDVTDSQMEVLSATLLEHIRERGPSGLVIDASGVWLMDSHLCAVLGRIAGAARLMGTRPVLSGLSPSVVMTLDQMGIALDGIETALGLEAALERLGLEVSDTSEAIDDELGVDAERGSER
jgi:rsbT antagonist protein RsbS